MVRNYNFDLLFRHSNDIALTTRRNLKTEVMGARKIFSFLNRHFHTLEELPKGHPRNVKLALTARFTNHMFSALMLIERGLILDAVNCTRTAIETTCLYWLVCRDPSASNLYDAEKSLPPVEVRKRLEGLGIDVSTLREKYALESTIAHVGNRYDQLQIRWEDATEGRLLVGGGLVPDVQARMLQGLTIATMLFVKHDQNYVVTETEATITADPASS